ncbi:WhiB family transcriptional regulator [Cellulomonas carbonis]|uniref:Transcriptional regulator WhiB n=1 Tax=Cellulomonas carbonis T26 TaxID=947969 RepID=A0A0A0BY17_9CELL|nr:WhiB family transcriptional regulator [Cellulomonas carbonis]KGM12801.1 transcription factor WhiB [Cellulomonas carbonis T26]GGC14784.1 transcriptional regulator WhiB [Cellulomonas carbonis]
MRLTTLLDTLNQGGSGPWPTTPTTSAATDGDAFDRLVATLIPCREHDAELWFAESTADVELAKSLCQECPVRAGCLAGAIAREEPWGVWGGEVFVGGVVVPRKRGRGRPRKDEAAPAA